MKNRGLYNKFIVVRTDGQSAKGGKHENCRYFVLDLDHDKHAIAAIETYAESCKEDYPELAKDLTAEVVQMEDKQKKAKCTIEQSAFKVHWKCQKCKHKNKIRTTPWHDDFVACANCGTFFQVEGV